MEDSKASRGGKRIEISLTNSFWGFSKFVYLSLLASVFGISLIEFSKANESLSKAFVLNLSLFKRVFGIEKSFKEMFMHFGTWLFELKYFIFSFLGVE